MMGIQQTWERMSKRVRQKEPSLRLRVLVRPGQISLIYFVVYVEAHLVNNGYIKFSVEDLSTPSPDAEL